MNIEQSLKKTWIYKHIYIPFRKRNSSKVTALKNRIFLEEALNVLGLFANPLKNGNIMFWLEYGTLLGFVREKGFIDHDFDIDVGAFRHDAAQIYKVLIQAGFKLVREFHVIGEDGLEQTYAYNNLTIDVFYFQENDEQQMVCNTFCYYQKAIFGRPQYAIVREISFSKFSLTPTNFLGCDVYIPTDYDTHLKEHYGSNYMIPDPNFKTPFNSRIFSIKDKKAVCHCIM